MLKNLSQLSPDRLAKEPAVLQLRLEELSGALEQAVINNCSMLLSSSSCLTYVEDDASSLSRGLSALQLSLPELKERLQDFMDASGSASSRHAALQLLCVMQETVTELLSLPVLIRSCFKAGLYNEALDLAVFAREVEQERLACHSALLQELGTAENFASTVRLLGHLRRVGLFSEGYLRLQFIDRRGAPVSSLKTAVETQCITDPVRGLCAAASLLNGAIMEVVTQYKAIFGDLDPSISFWLRAQVKWFLVLLRNKLGPSSHECRNELFSGDRRYIQGRQSYVHSVDGRMVQHRVVSLCHEQAGDETSSLEAASLSLLYRHTHHAACGLRRVRGFFLPAAVPIFEQHLRALLWRKAGYAVKRFSQELSCYGWESSALFRSFVEKRNEYPGSAGHPVGFPVPGETAGAHERFALLRHPPLCVFLNELLKILNTALDFPLFSVVIALPALFKRILLNGAYLLAEVQRAVVDHLTDLQKRDEFASLCQAYSDDLLPLLAADLESVVGVKETHSVVFSEVKCWMERQRLGGAASISTGDVLQTGSDTSLLHLHPVSCIQPLITNA
ncbi:hypothetical protein BESB_045280 [Besnoitia besnoiti]|uniref:Conserved oligomeric Golgi complex subunit 8 n=1 Tax=Besnoitia besnoiti TaxID=94643 RepID=A0A2A9MK43_BESBE|nr:hypothetical protein BESB_045280 [Besnoitia besnoiti]PFH36336.1 hypothetical protein BESB_045280 [Besnoitia besnoiti]